MIEGDFDATPEQIGRIAGLHADAMPHSALGAMGRRTLRRYYSWVVRSTLERLFVVEDSGRVVGAAVLSREPETVLRRFVRAAPLRFAGEAGRAYFRTHAFRQALHAYLRECIGDRTLADDTTPEVLQIFVAPGLRHRRLGSQLLAAVERRLTAEGTTRYQVRTLSDDNDETLRFYERRFFRPHAESWFCGRRYLILRRSVIDSSSHV
jgi:GNAT superfamily N-acetyltransferase